MMPSENCPDYPFSCNNTSDQSSQANPVLKRLFDKLLLLKSTDSPIGFSGGAVSFVDPLPNSADQALGAADKLMYTVKASGKNQVVQARYEG